PCPVRRRAYQRPRGRERGALPDRDPGRRRHLGGPALERHGIPAGLLPQVPLLRQVLPALGARRVPGRARVRGPEQATPFPLPLRRLEALARSAPAVGQALGRFGRSLAAALALAVVPPFRPRRLVDRLHFIGFRSLTIVILTGAFTGMVLGLQIFLVLSRFGAEGFLGPPVALAPIRPLRPVLC